MPIFRRSRGTPPSADAEHEIFGVRAHVRRFHGTTFFVPDYAAHKPVSKRILSGKLVVPRLHKLVSDVMAHRPGSMVHAGTFFGDMLTSFSRKTPGTVYAFEPVLENYLFAHATVEANRLDNVMLFHAGLGSESALGEVETANPNGRHRGGMSYVIQPGDRRPRITTQRVPLLSVDQVEIPDLSIIQLDVEGHEPHVLRGAERSIELTRPVIVVEDKLGRCADLLRAWRYVEVEVPLHLDRAFVPEEQLTELRHVVAGDLPDHAGDDELQP